MTVMPAFLRSHAASISARLLLAVLTLGIAAGSFAQSVATVKPPKLLTAGTPAKVALQYTTDEPGIVQIQLFDPGWKKVAASHINVAPGNRTEQLDVFIGGALRPAGGYIWQAVLYTPQWRKLAESVAYGVRVEEDDGGGDDSEWLPPGSWRLDTTLSEEFSKAGLPEKFFPMLGYNPKDYASSNEKGLRWSEPYDPETAAMHSTRFGNHWVADGVLAMQVITDKQRSNKLGVKVNSAYLISGRPVARDASEPTGVRWEGYKVSPRDGPIYISARIRTDYVQGWSSWFAFWLFSETRAYNNVPRDGTEVDIFEVAKGRPDYMRHAFNVANHWGDGSESKQFNGAEALQFVDVTDSKFHVWGLEWSTTEMKFYVDGKQYYRITNNIPSDPVDMFMLLTLEYQKNLWDANAGDGRIEGPKVTENSRRRVLSRAYVDYVRVHRKR